MGLGHNHQDPDQLGDQQGQGQTRNDDNDDQGMAPPPPAPGDATIPLDYVTFVNGLPSGFVAAFQADAPGGIPWSPLVLADTTFDAATLTAPTALFTDFTAPQAQPLVLTGDNPVGLINDSTAPLTVVDNATPYQYVATGMGGMTLFAESANGSFVAEGGSNVVVTGQTQVSAWSFDLLGGNNQVWANDGNDTIQTAAGSTNLIAFGSGNDIAASGGTDLFIGGSGNDTIFATGSNDSVLGGSGNMTFINTNTTPDSQSDLIFGGSGTLDVVGGLGSVTVVGGSGGGLIFGGAAGNNELVGGAGPATLVGGGTGDLLIAGPTGGDKLVASVGNETLIGASGGNNVLWGGTGNDVMVMNGGNNTVMGGSSGTDVIWSGSGNNFIGANAANVMVVAGPGGNNTVQAGTGMDIFTFVNCQAGGSAVINNFNTATDSINLVGYGAHADTVASVGGSTLITLADKTQIQLVGVTNLPSSAIG